MLGSLELHEVVSSTRAPTAIATGLAQRPQEGLGPKEEDAFIRNWTVSCTIGACSVSFIDTEKTETTVLFHNPMINTD